MTDDWRPPLRVVRETVGSYVFGRWFVDLGGDHTDAVVIAGSGRSGTTWLANVVNHRNEFRYIFEPFHPRHVEICRHFPHRKYLRPTETGQAWLEPVRRILEGRIRGRWVDAYNRRLLSRRRLIKTTRANLFLRWLHVRFPGTPIVLLLRNPCAVAVSRLRVGWSVRPPKLLAQEELVEDHLGPFEAPMRRAEGEFEKAIFLWCVDTYVPLRQFRAGEIHLVFYEDLHRQPQREVERLFTFLGRPHDDRVHGDLRQPSRQSRSDSAVVAGGDPLRDWRRFVSPADIRRAEEILTLFGLDGLYDHEGLPVPGVAENVGPAGFGLERRDSG